MIWKLKKGADRRVRAGHPWVFSAELAQAPKGVVSGSPVDLQDDAGRFVARGYANPASMITFRALTFDPKETDVLMRPGLLRRTLESWESRRRLGYRGSFRMVFAEGDRMPGLIIDYYRGEAAGRPIQVFALQISTAGMNKAFGEPETFFRELVTEALEKKLTTIPWEDSAVVLRNDIRARTQEGLTEEAPRFVKSVREADFTNFKILLNAATDDGFVEMNCDLFLGQKTGFFLDQTANIQTVCQLLTQDPDLPKDRPIRVLDLCCYVGHWSSQITRTLKRRGFDVDVTLVDVSVKALQFARQNVERQGGKVAVVEADVLKSLSNIEPAFDVVVADPPAFIKSKKDIPIGKHAYMKVNTHAFRLATAKGLVVSCSCSGLLDEENFKEVIAKALRRNFLDARCVARGGPAPDHPGRLSFPEGMYLKMYVHQLSGQTSGAAIGNEEPLDAVDVAGLAAGLGED
jgi:23S rRNA (cytosine1962-C5)-methyltransferase